MSAQQNKSLVRREQEELWNHTGELKAAEELFAADQPEAAKKEEAAHFCRGFPDVISTIEDLIAEQVDDRCADRLLALMHQGELDQRPTDGLAQLHLRPPPPHPPTQDALHVRDRVAFQDG
jgi:hypothetical protein